MSDPRFDRCERTIRVAHPCSWCPDDIPAGTLCASWCCVEADRRPHRRWAHVLCESIAVDEVAEAFGDDDHLLAAPDRESLLRTLSFFDSESDVRAICVGEFRDDADRLAALWRHPTVRGWIAAAAARRRKP